MKQIIILTAVILAVFSCSSISKNLVDNPENFRLRTGIFSFNLLTPEAGNTVGSLISEEGKTGDTFTFTGGDSYNGASLEGRAEGKGRWQKANGLFYEGDWKNGQPHGEGVFEHPSKIRYKGGWNGGLPHGSGSAVISGDKYTGDFISGRPHGKGEYTWSDGTVYSGSWVTGEPEATGRITYSDRSFYEGEFKTGFPSGKGTYTYASGESVAGLWLEGKLIEGCVSGDCVNGTGTYVSKDASKYTGSFSGGKYSGEGRINYKDGRVITAEFKNGKPEGKALIESESALIETFYSGGVAVGRCLIKLKADGEGEADLVKGTITGKVSVKWPDGRSFTGTFSGGRPEGRGEFRWSDGSVYTGGFSGDNRFGKPLLDDPAGVDYIAYWSDSSMNDKKAVILFSDGTRYTGSVVNGAVTGDGVKYFADGHVEKGYRENGILIEGCIQGNCAGGSGRTLYKDGSIYSGTFVRGKAEGRGILLKPLERLKWRYIPGSSGYASFSTFNKKGAVFYADGGFYEGGLEKHSADSYLQNGAGIIRFSNGSVYTGYFRDGKISGAGELTQPDGSSVKGWWNETAIIKQNDNIKLPSMDEIAYVKGEMYDGAFKNGLKSGYGEIKFSNGDRYKGEFFNDRINGSGEYLFSSGDIYRGAFKNGQPEGRGIYTWKTGERYEGEYKNGFRAGRGILTFSFGGTYTGEFRNGTREGRGVMDFGGGERYDGQWKNGLRHGTGTMTYINGDSYTGQWQNDLRNGKGVLSKNDGSSSSGLWENDTLLK